jgi:uncharacterized protein YjbI with pentapeptide repeats
MVSSVNQEEVRMKIRMTFMMILVVFSGVLTNVYGESQQRWSEVPARVLTSYDFLEDPDLVAHNDDLVLIFLDAAQIPEMSIPYENSQTHTRTICWDQEGSSHTATLIDASGNPVFTLGSGACVSLTIEAGFYTLNFTHDGTGEPSTFVLQPNSGEMGGAETEISPNYYQEHLDQLINTNQCDHCVLDGADLTGADLTGADLTGAYLRSVNLRGADLTGADLHWAHLDQWYYGAPVTNLSWANLSGADLYEANLLRANLSETDLTGADLHWAFLNGVNLFGADLTGANLRGANLRNANLTGADFTEADLREVKLWYEVFGSMVWADLTGGILIRANLHKVDLTYVELRGADLTGADLSEAILWLAEEVVLTGANLCLADLAYTELRGADLTGADLTGADLTGADLSGADLSGATWVDGSQCGPGSIGRCVPIRTN